MTAPAAAIDHATPTDRPSGAAESVVLSVTAGGQDFAIDAGAIREIRGWTPPIPLPGAPHFVQGMSDLRGEMMVLVVLAARMGVGQAPATLPVTVVVEGRDSLVGLVVDAVSDLHSIGAAQVRPVPETGLPTPSELLRGVVEIDGRLLGLVAVDQILPAGQAREGRVAID